MNRTGVAGQQLNRSVGFPKSVMVNPQQFNRTPRIYIVLVVGIPQQRGYHLSPANPGCLCLSSGLWLRSGDTGSVAFVGEHEPPDA